MNKRFLSILLIFSMLFSFVPSLNFSAYGENTEKQIRVRIEGKMDTLFDEEVTVTNEVYGIDILKTTIGQENIEGSDSQYGYLMEGLCGERTVIGDVYETSWGLYISKDGVLESSSVGISTLNIEDIDELLLHKKATDKSWNDLTFIPKLYIKQQENKIEFTVKKIISIYGQEDKEETVEGANLKVAGKEYITDDNGEVKVELDAGTYDISVYKEGENYPELIRRTFEIIIDEPQIPKELIQVRVEGFEQTLYNEEIEYSFNSETHPLDVLKETVGADKIEGKESSMGFFITGILGKSQAENQGWCYYVKDKKGHMIMPSVGVDQFEGMTNLEGKAVIDELVFYKCSYSGNNIVTKIPVVIVEKDKANFKIKVVNNEVGNEPIKNVDVKVGNEGNYKTNENGEVSFVLNKAGNYNVEISKDNGYPEIVRQHLVLESEGSNTDELENIINELKATYQAKDVSTLKAVDVMAYNSLMNDKNDYKKSFKLNTSENAAAYAENIMGCLATGQDVSSYVDLLVDSQDENGEFVVGSNDANSVTTLVDSITALDMAKASYDTEKAIKALTDSANSGHYEDVTTTAYALRALLKHKNMDGVEGLITSSIAYLKDQQLDCGGYDISGYGNSPYVTGLVVQALVRGNENILSDGWKKNNNTMVDSMLVCYLGEGSFDFAQGWNYGEETSSRNAFAALSDVYCGISMYDRFTLESSGTEKNYDELIDNAIDGIRDYLTSMETRMDSKYVSHPAFYRSLEVIGLNCTSEDIQKDVEDLSNKFNINENEGTLPYIMNIIGLKASGQNCEKYVDLLKAGQQEDGTFKIGRVEQTEWAVIALDMVGAEYNVNKAVQGIMDNNKDQEDISLLAVAITALAPHKNIDGVEEFINTKLDYIKSKQLETGGFEMADMMSGESVESSLPTSYVISALVANGIDPRTDKEWIKGENTLLDALLKFKKLNYFLCNNGQYAEYFGKDEATEQAFIALADLQNKKSSYQNVQDAISYKGLVKDSLLKLRDYLTTTERRKNASLEDIDVYYSWQEALAINYISDDLDREYKDIQDKLKLDNKDNVLSYAQDIMGIIASGQNPKGFEGKNYVEALVDFQNEQGKFVEEGKDSNVYKQSYSMMALDMTQAEYNVEKAVNALVSMASGDNFGSVEETALALIALSKHEDINGISNLIDSGIDYLKDNQSDNGGFDMMGYGDTPQYTAVVIQALIANGIDPLSSEWIKENGNLVTSMINDQMEDGTFRACKMFGDFVDNPSTERAFAALADLYTGESMYKEVEPILDDSEIVKKIIRQLKEYYEDDNKYNYLQAMGLNIAGMDQNDISNNLELREEEADRTYIVWDNNTEMHAKNIMGIIAAGENPRDYKEKNYVDILVKAQDESGIFDIDGQSIRSQAYSIISLDMADADYDVKKAIDILTANYEEIDKPSVYTASAVIIALSNHKDMEGITEKIDSYLEDLKEMQIDTGGFDYNKGSIIDDPHEVSEYDAIAIQAIIAVGKDPLSEEFQKNGKTVFDAMMAFKKDDHFVYDSQKSSYKEYTDEATGMVLAALVDLDSNESMYHSLAIEYDGGQEAKTNEEKIIEAINDLRGYYAKDDIFTFREAIGYNFTSDYIENDLKIIQLKYKVNENPGQASDYAGNIIGLIAAGKNPRDYYGKNYIQALVKAQAKSGVFQVENEGGYPTQTVFSMIALDMADADYNKELAVKALMNFQNTDGNFGDIDTTAMAIMALAKHKGMDGVKDCIDKAVNYIQSQQINTGGFIAWGSENPYTAAAVIQGLIAVGEDPLSEKWTKNNKTMLDSLLSFKVEDHFENKSKYGTEINGITEQAFMALADLKMGKSMYHELAITYIEPIKVNKVEIQKPLNPVMKVNTTVNLTAKTFDKNNKEITTEGITWESSDSNIAVVDKNGFVVGKAEGTVTITAKVTGNENIKDTIELIVEAVPTQEFEIKRVGEEIFKNGNEAKLQVKVKNNSEKNQIATFIIALYDRDSSKMMNYSYVIENINAGEGKDMIGGFLVPKDGNYEVRGFVWDNFEDQNILLTKPILVEVQK